MHRKEFLKNGWLLFTPTLSKSLGVKKILPHKQSIKLPAYLTNGSIIGITAPAGFITLPEIEPCINMLTRWGFQVIIGNTIGKKDGTLGGTDAERLADMQQMLDAENIAAIMCARGGYGIVRIIDRLQWKIFAKNPKWIIGFSDITYLHGLL
jgi:muramoyltetrapeptide carboxypeptidase